MAREIRSFAITIPPGGSAADPQTFDVSFPPRIVEEIDILVPPGPLGNVGFAIGSGGTAVIPIQPGEYIITDNEHIRWPLTGYIDSGAWQLLAYNEGQFDHTLYIRFLVGLTQTSEAAVPSGQLPNQLLAGGIPSGLPVVGGLPIGGGGTAPVPPPSNPLAGITLVPVDLPTSTGSSQ